MRYGYCFHVSFPLEDLVVACFEHFLGGYTSACGFFPSLNDKG